jgi:hypothetical protein
MIISVPRNWVYAASRSLSSRFTERYAPWYCVALRRRTRTRMEAETRWVNGEGTERVDLVRYEDDRTLYHSDEDKEGRDGVLTRQGVLRCL